MKTIQFSKTVGIFLVVLAATSVSLNSRASSDYDHPVEFLTGGGLGIVGVAKYLDKTNHIKIELDTFQPEAGDKVILNVEITNKQRFINFEKKLIAEAEEIRNEIQRLSEEKSRPNMSREARLKIDSKIRSLRSAARYAEYELDRVMKRGGTVLSSQLGEAKAVRIIHMTSNDKRELLRKIEELEFRGEKVKEARVITKQGQKALARGKALGVAGVLVGGGLMLDALTAGAVPSHIRNLSLGDSSKLNEISINRGMGSGTDTQDQKVSTSSRR